MSRQSYEGSCHCGSIVFEVESDLRLVGRCNCSYCSRLGSVMTPVGAERFRLREDSGDLSEYQFGDARVRHFFCRRCGVHPFHTTGAGAYVVNVACLAGVEVDQLDPIWSDGRSR